MDNLNLIKIKILTRPSFVSCTILENGIILFVNTSKDIDMCVNVKCFNTHPSLSFSDDNIDWNDVDNISSEFSNKVIERESHLNLSVKDNDVIPTHAIISFKPKMTLSAQDKEVIGEFVYSYDGDILIVDDVLAVIQVLSNFKIIDGAKFSEAVINKEDGIATKVMDVLDYLFDEDDRKDIMNTYKGNN